MVELLDDDELNGPPLTRAQCSDIRARGAKRAAAAVMRKRRSSPVFGARFHRKKGTTSITLPKVSILESDP